MLSLEDRDADELVLVLTGYHRLLAGGGGQEELNVVRQKSEFSAGREICECTKPNHILSTVITCTLSNHKNADNFYLWHDQKHAGHLMIQSR